MVHPLAISIRPVTYADIPALAKISGDSFIEDRHTQMKGLGKKPYVMEDVALEDIASYLGSEKLVCVKAVDDTTGEPVGWSCWGFRGFEPQEIPREDPGPRENRSQTESPKTATVEEEPSVTGEIDDEVDIIARLTAMTDADMNHWMRVLMPVGARCMYVVSLSVAPAAQSRGVGSALLKWGTDLADRFGVYAWVHSSEAAWRHYSKHGFEIVGTLDVDLDEWAPGPPPLEEGEGAIWGHYVFRYMKRFPKEI